MPPRPGGQPRRAHGETAALARPRSECEESAPGGFELKLFVLVVASLLALVAPAAAQVGYRTTAAADAADVPLEVHVWYPAAETGTPQRLGPYTQIVAADAPIATGRHPLVVISHGSGGSGTNQHDIAAALARAGFVVAAVTHTGDNSRDQRYVGTRQFSERSRHVARLIDHMTRNWPEHASIDPSRIGVYGYSAGATTALITLGGRPDLAKFDAHCAAHPEAWDCRLIAAARAEAAAAGVAPASGPAVFTADPRVKAGFIVAPALGYTFVDGGLDRVRRPVQLWVGEKDEITPAVWNADVVARNLAARPPVRMVAGASHYSFLPPCSAELSAAVPFICAEPAGFDRAAFHRGLALSAVEFFGATLKPAPTGRD